MASDTLRRREKTEDLPLGPDANRRADFLSFVAAAFGFFKSEAFVAFRHFPK